MTGTEDYVPDSNDGEAGTRQRPQALHCKYGVVGLELSLVVSGRCSTVALFEQLVSTLVENLIVNGETFEKTVGILIQLGREEATRLCNVQGYLLASVVN